MEKKMKKCGRCKQQKSISEFYKDKAQKDGFCYDCKECRKIANKISQSKHLKRKWENTKKWRSLNQEKFKASKKFSDAKYYEKNKERVLQQVAVYKQNNIEKVSRCLEKSREKWRQANPDYIIKKYHSDINFKLKMNLRSRINSVLKGKIKSGSAVRDLGCSIEELKQHLENQFQDGMTWENHGKWHIDHIKPLSLFDLTNRKEFLEACHYTNLQPLWAKDNLQKGDKYVDWS